MYDDRINERCIAKQLIYYPTLAVNRSGYFERAVPDEMVEGCAERSGGQVKPRGIKRKIVMYRILHFEHLIRRVHNRDPRIPALNPYVRC